MKNLNTTMSQTKILRTGFLKSVLTFSLFAFIQLASNAQCTGDCQNGKGKNVDTDGNSFEGNWINGKLNGPGVMALPNGIKYVGEFKDDAMHGYGVVYLANGNVAQAGIFENNKLSTTLSESVVTEALKKKKNESTATASNGCTGDCQNGKGKNVDSDGNSFEGNWINGKLNGQGVMSLPNGIKYIGEFKDDAMHGYGVVYLANGNVAQAGIFENNKLSTTLSESAVTEALNKKKNESTSTASNGCTGDCQNGKGKKVDADGNIFEGTWKNGELEGKGVMAMPNGVKYVGEFKNGSMHGYGAVYTANGAVAQSGVFENNALKTSKSESEVKMYLMKYN